MCLVREQPKCLGGCCVSLCPGAELTALCCGMTHISNPQNSSSFMAGAHRCPTWMEPSRASCTDVGKQDLARHSPWSWWHRLCVPSAWSWQLSMEGSLCQTRATPVSGQVQAATNSSHCQGKDGKSPKNKYHKYLHKLAGLLSPCAHCQNYRITEWLEGP